MSTSTNNSLELNTTRTPHYIPHGSVHGNRRCSGASTVAQPWPAIRGTSINIAHSAPTPVGAKVTAEAKYIGQKGKLYQFEVIAKDEAGEVGRGGHERAIVEIARLETGARKRGSQ
ncbi:hypothetical protein BDV39DRAFT_198627 [Aspergillus sergii]|uniref:Fluoroacetyl-CoA-specific thioesterase-like domain-containing protein n=1 Tax=Aspergillus sergii TaxID=1034303 RepID=A0A5N6XKE0_9EURO|nr:hypothetical protein BDV39DRAFT_198627 [Aspergillus sergii]